MRQRRSTIILKIAFLIGAVVVIAALGFPAHSLLRRALVGGGVLCMLVSSAVFQEMAWRAMADLTQPLPNGGDEVSTTSDDFRAADPLEKAEAAE